MNLEVKTDPRSDMISSGVPWCFHTWWRYNVGAPLESIASFVEMKWTNLVFLSTTTIIASNPLLFGNFTMKSVVTFFQGASAAGIGCSNPYRPWCVGFDLWHMSHPSTYRWTYRRKVGQSKFLDTNSIVFARPGWPANRASCREHNIWRLSSSLSGTNIWSRKYRIPLVKR